MITVTHGGRFGDLLWACPTLRALAAVHGPIRLVIPKEFASIAPLLEAQAYIGEVEVHHGWTPDPAHPREVPGFDGAVHLSYHGWPSLPLPYETYRILCTEYVTEGVPPLDLETPWITVKPYTLSHLVAGWTETYFELKVGLTTLLERAFGRPPVLVPRGGRWDNEARTPVEVWPCPIAQAAVYIAGAKVSLTDCSALHVLAVALGVPVVVVEPMEARHNNIFWPMGMDGPRVRCVKGNDGKPTHDARHTADVLREVLHATA